MVIAGLVFGVFGLIGIAGCSNGTEPELRDFRVQADNLTVAGIDGFLMLTQNATAAAYPEALFEGAVAGDEAGCLRLQDPQGDHGATAVWPEGYDLRDVAGSHRIVNAAGGTVGTVGENIELGGGEVHELPDALGFTDADRELAAARCPGLYWIVSPPELS